MFAANGNYHVPDGTGLLLVGHGSREPVGVAEFLETARRVAQRAGAAPVEPCFLEFARPTIAEAFAALVRRGARRVVVAPVLLFAAGHAKRDIPAAVAAAAKGSPTTDVVKCGHLGCHAAIVELAAKRYREAIATAPPTDEADAVLVVVGRGSRDPEATAEMQRFVELLACAAEVRRARTCFVAMAEPRLDKVLEEVAASGARRIVVQPHLLFGGVLVDRIAQTVAEFAARYREICWLNSAHLGPSDLVAAAVLERIGQRLALPRG